ncbi:hypothetical protein DFH08DRAFT_823181 [Mycena albidolilacea]|uniref:Uncharacterized protein n=1 Tax=Mycena albidolilacea TaxID=1033008 RepID=A0AAD6Z6Q9_9AGAR|nr:hypothetical protein DFH08DRAFT_823181 [Mycena albidolilacea]
MLKLSICWFPIHFGLFFAAVFLSVLFFSLRLLVITAANTIVWANPAQRLEHGRWWGGSSGACTDGTWMERAMSHFLMRFTDTSEQCELQRNRSKISVGVRGVICDLADTILKSTWFACNPSYTAAHYCETDLSLITTIYVYVLCSDFKLRLRGVYNFHLCFIILHTGSHNRSPNTGEFKLDSRSGNITSMFNPALAPDTAGSAMPDFNFIFVIPESSMSSIVRTNILESGPFIIIVSVSNVSPMHLRVDHRTHNSGCVPAAPVEFPSIVLASGAAVNMLIQYSTVP